MCTLQVHGVYLYIHFVFLSFPASVFVQFDFLIQRSLSFKPIPLANIGLFSFYLLQSIHRAAAARVLAFHPHFCDAQFQASSSSSSSSISTSSTSKSGHQIHHRCRHRLLSSRPGALGGVTSLAWASTHPNSNRAHSHETEEEEQVWLTVGFADGSVRVYDASKAVWEGEESEEEKLSSGSGVVKTKEEDHEKKRKASSSSSSSFPLPLPLVAVLQYNDQVG